MAGDYMEFLRCQAQLKIVCRSKDELIDMDRLEYAYQIIEPYIWENAPDNKPRKCGK